jgi:hypothetical protein
MRSLMTLKPSDTSRGLHLGPVGRREVHFVGSRRGEMPNWPPFRVIVIFCGKWETLMVRPTLSPPETPNPNG